MAKVLVIGDLHITDAYVGTHKDYWAECLDVLGKVTRIVKEKGVTHLILTGDLVGLREKNFRNRDSLMTFMMALKQWNSLTDGNVYSVIGNHDMGGRTTDFDVFESIGLVQTTRTLGVTHIEVDGARFHLINYGDEYLPVEIGGRANIAVTHADIQVQGKTTWWHPSRQVFELSSMHNWRGIEMIVGGHIHNPSPYTVSTDIEGSNVDLIYLGCPLRPKRGDDWTLSWGCLFDTDTEVVNCDLVEIMLLQDVFVQTMSDIDEEVEELEVTRVEELARILNTLSEYKLDSDDDIEGQIRRFSGVDTKAMNLALEYYDKVRSE